MNKNLILLIVILGCLLFFNNNGSSIKPVFDEPMSEYVFDNTKNLPDDEKKIVASCFNEVYQEITKLTDPLYQPKYQLAYPQDAITAVHSLINQSVKNNRWDKLFEQLDKYIRTYDNIDNDKNHPDRSIFAIGEQFRLIANGLVPNNFNDSRMLMGETSSDIEDAYINGEIVGVFLDQDDQPKYYRDIAKYDESSFEVLASSIDFGQFPVMAGEGNGKRAVYWNYAYRFPFRPYVLQQITGNCVFASVGDGIITHLLGVNIFLYHQPILFEGTGSTAMYAFRGHGGQGSTTSRAASVYLKYGYPVRKLYKDFDLRNETEDQRVGINNWRNPESSLSSLLDELKINPVGKIERLPSNFTEEYIKDLMYMGCAIHFGGTLIGAKNGDPISTVGSVGPHAMCVIGYDDTQEFKNWYKEKTGKTLKQSVFMFDNSWGEGPKYVQRNWPSHLWGKETGGMYVLNWEDTKRLISGSGYVYYPFGMKGASPEIVNYRLKLAKE